MYMIKHDKLYLILYIFCPRCMRVCLPARITSSGRCLAWKRTRPGKTLEAFVGSFLFELCTGVNCDGESMKGPIMRGARSLDKRVTVADPAPLSAKDFCSGRQRHAP